VETRFINLDRLNTLAQDAGCSIYLDVLPGRILSKGTVLAHKYCWEGPVGPNSTFASGGHPTALTSGWTANVNRALA
jgi:hypothetical protein